MEQAVDALRVDMGQLRETMIVTAKEATDLALAPVKATLQQLESGSRRFSESQDQSGNATCRD